MKRLQVLIEAPVLTNSGYGRRSVDFIKALHLARPEYDLKIVPLRWGDTSWDALDENDINNKVIFDNILKEPLKEQPDIHIQITVPNETRPVGKFNILITAGIETNLSSHTWIEGCNRVNLVLTSSNHSKDVFLNSKYSEVDKLTQKVKNELSLKVPIEVLFEGYDEKVFFKTTEIEDSINTLFNDIETNFNFLFVGHWLNGNLGEDRKNVGMMIHTFLDTFKDKENAPGLILKTNGGTTSRIDYHRLVTMVNQIKGLIEYSTSLPPIYIIHGNLSNTELNSLYNHNKVKSFLSFTKGEGFFRPCLEFCMTKKPILVSNWSGHLDFLTPTGVTLLKGELTNVDKSVVWNEVIIPESKWFTVNYENAKEDMLNVFNNYNSVLNKAKKNTKYKEFTFDEMVNKIDYLFTKYIPSHLTSELITLKL